MCWSPEIDTKLSDLYYTGVLKSHILYRHSKKHLFSISLLFSLPSFSLHRPKCGLFTIPFSWLVRLLFNMLIYRKSCRNEKPVSGSLMAGQVFFSFFVAGRTDGEPFPKLTLPSQCCYGSLAHCDLVSSENDAVSDPGRTLKNVFPHGNETAAALEHSSIQQGTLYQKEQLCWIAPAIRRTCANMQLWCKLETRKPHWNQWPPF